MFPNIECIFSANFFSLGYLSLLANFQKLSRVGAPFQICGPIHKRREGPWPVFPLRKFYTEQMFVLLRTKRMQLCNHTDTQTVKRFKR